MEQPVPVQGLTLRSVIRVAFTEWGQAHKHASEVREAPGERTCWLPHTKVLGPTLGALATALKLAGEEDSVTVWAPPGTSEVEGGGGGKGMEEGCSGHSESQATGPGPDGSKALSAGRVQLHVPHTPSRCLTWEVRPLLCPQDPYPHRPHHTSRDLTRPQ